MVFSLVCAACEALASALGAPNAATSRAPCQATDLVPRRAVAQGFGQEPSAQSRPSAASWTRHFATNPDSRRGYEARLHFSARQGSGTPFDRRAGGENSSETELDLTLAAAKAAV